MSRSLQCVTDCLVGLGWTVAWAAGMALPARGQPAAEQGSATAASSGLESVHVQAPQTAYVVVSSAEVHSGPGSDFYPTSRVARGTAVEVYHRSESGWLGIRPPENSFSWVPAQDAYLLPGGRVIEITQAGAVAWIGTALGSAKQYRWQVQLSKGEQLAVLGETTTTNAAGQAALWYKIAPPAGEFRWIHEEAVGLQPPPPEQTMLAARRGDPADAAVGPAAASSDSQRQSSATSAAARKGAPRARDSKPASRGGDSAVQTAGFQDDIFSDSPIMIGEGEVIYEDGDVIYEGGEMVYGEGEIIYDEQGMPYEGEVIYEGDAYYEPGVQGSSTGKSSRWDGWHVFELTDDGFRIPFLERRYRESQARAAQDPRNHDPFDLSMTPRAQPTTTSVPTAVRSAAPPPAIRRHTPWRDPRDLRQKRLQGYPDSRASFSGSGPTFSESYAADHSADAPLAAAQDLVGRLVSSANRLTSAGQPTAANADYAAAASATLGAVDLQGVNWHGLSNNAVNVSAGSVAGADLNQLQLALSEMVAQPMQVWNLQPLIVQAKQVVEHGPSPLERGQARLLLERMEAFELLAQKAGWGGSAFVQTASASLAPLQNQATAVGTAAYQTTAPAGVADPGAYDASGWLVPVHAQSAGQPTHALTNDAGQIIAYVSGLAGMNLSRYENEPVGITGLRGYLPQLQAPHLQAQRVVRLR